MFQADRQQAVQMDSRENSTEGEQKGKISDRTQTIVCLPHKLVVEVENVQAVFSPVIIQVSLYRYLTRSLSSLISAGGMKEGFTIPHM